MTEQEVIEVLRARDGGSTTITFLLDSNTAVVDFPVVSNMDDNGGPLFEPGPATLHLDDDDYAVTQVPERDLSGYEFMCRDHPQ